MPLDESPLQHNLLSKASRRNFLKTAPAFAIAGSAIASGLQSEGKETQSPRRPRLLYVGTYSSQQGPEGSIGRGRGIHLFEMNYSTGALTPREIFANSSNPSWLALHPSKTHLYSADEIDHYQGKSSGAVSAYSIERSTGRLTHLNTVSSGGAGPAHISVHPSGRYVMAANYAGGTVAVLPIRTNGEVGPAVDIHHDEGPVGPQHATSAPPGSFAISGHDAPHAHMIHADPSGKRVISTDLGMDKILIWNFDLEKGKLTPGSPHSVPVPPGDGPRHFVFHPNGRWFYCVQEEGSVVIGFDYDDSAGALTQKQIVSALPAGFTGTNFSSEIRISPDAKFLYAANRLHDTVAIFSIGRSGRLVYAGEEWTHGDYPRSFTIDPSGNFLFSCNQRSDSVTSFRVNRQTGRLTFTGQYTPVGTPAVVVFLA
jgi:6-phosphogluconolactonase